MLNDDERKAKLKEIALRMYIAGLGWNYEALERLTDPNPPTFKRFLDLQRIPEKTPFERGYLDRFQHKRKCRKY